MDDGLIETASRDTTIERLAAIVGADHILVGDDRAFYAHDVFRPGAMPAAVVLPGTVEELQAVVAAATGAGLAIVPRGGGASYTDGYLPVTPQSIIIDTGRLNRIVEIDETDMFVTVEPGVTWAELTTALAARGLRTPFFGPFSGLVATVGGAVSQHSVSHGTGGYGTSAESVIAMEVVLASGAILKTAQAGSLTGHPFFRFYGPDLTALFTGDCGALGVKARITLRLIKRRPLAHGLSFAFSSFDQLQRAMSKIAAEGLEDENFALDAALSQGQIARNTTTQRKLEMIGGIVRSTRNPVTVAAKLLRLAASGTDTLTRPGFFAHYIVTGIDRREVAAKCQAIQQIGTRDGVEIANAVPTIVQSMPFAPLFNILGPKGERWVPLHGILPHSRVLDFHREATALFDQNRDEMARLKIFNGAMFSAIGTSAFLYEPALYWEDVRTVFHNTILDPSHLSTLPDYAPNPDGAALVSRLKTELIEIFHRLGAAHFQVGKVYPLLRDRDPQSVALLRAIKQALDPNGLMNPAALGLAADGGSRVSNTMKVGA